MDRILYYSFIFIYLCDGISGVYKWEPCLLVNEQVGALWFCLCNMLLVNFGSRHLFGAHWHLSKHVYWLKETGFWKGPSQCIQMGLMPPQNHFCLLWNRQALTRQALLPQRNPNATKKARPVSSYWEISKCLSITPYLPFQTHRPLYHGSVFPAFSKWSLTRGYRLTINQGTMHHD